MSKGNKQERIAVHRLVAKAFVENPNNYPEVNHIDCDRNNPYYKNLEWVSHSDNVKHSVKIGRYKKPYYYGSGNPNAKKVRILNYNMDFDTIGDCAKYLISQNLTKGSIDNARNEIIKVYKGAQDSYLGLRFSLL